MPPEHARKLVERLRTVAADAVVYVELSGGQHSFDLFHSIRYEKLTDGIEAFAAAVGSARRDVPIDRPNGLVLAILGAPHFTGWTKWARGAHFC